ncbi:LOW QUALITY PROTEIN: stabilin-2-like [Podargus strigoides]
MTIPPQVYMQGGSVGNGFVCYGNIMEHLWDLNAKVGGQWRGKPTSALSLMENVYEWPLSTLGPFTVLVPTNKGLKGTNIKDLLNNKQKAQYFVKLHVIDSQLNTSSMNNTNIIYTLTGKSGEISKGEKDNQLRIRIQGEGKLLQGNIIASNGILHIVDKATDNVEPTFESSKEETIMSVLQGNERYSQFTSLIEKTGLGMDLQQDDRPYTVFVPSNEALSNMNAEALDYLLSAEGSWKLLELAQYHVVSNTELEVASLVSIEHIRSMAKQFIYFNRTSTGQLLVSGEEMEETDIVAKNGRIYTLAGVLIPPTIVPILPHQCDETSQVAMGVCTSCLSHELAPCPQDSKPIPFSKQRCIIEGPTFQKTGCARSCNITIKEPKCCKGFFGPDCSPCTGGFSKPCSGMGQCMDGLSGNGTCICAEAFQGSRCQFCSDPGKYRPQLILSCVCKPGYEGDGMSCSKVDPCAVNPGGCNINAECIQTDPGEHMCCQSGWTGDGSVCSAINNCLLPTVAGYHKDDTCINIGPGQNDCKCKDGFRGNRIECIPINSCLEQNGKCHHLATCQFDSSHGWECVPPKGYEGDGRICYGSAADVTSCTKVKLVLSTTSNLTILMPSLQAIEDMDEDEKRMSKSNIPTLLKYHVLTGAYSFADFQNLSSSDMLPTSLQSNFLHLSKENGNLTLEGAHIVTGDIASTNRIIYVIDKVLTPLCSTVMPKLLAHLEQMPDYSIFRGYIIQYSLANEIEAANTYTVFAPNNDAIESYLRDKKSATLDEDQIFYHVGLDEKLLKTSIHRETTLGFSYHIGFFLNNSQLFINDAPISYSNVATDKGVIHGLEKVLEIQKNRCDINDTMITIKKCRICSQPSSCPPGTKEIAGEKKYCILSENNMRTYTIQIRCWPKCAKTVITRECCAGFFKQQCQPCPGKAGNACFGNGVCLDGIKGTGTCECEEGFAGTACESCIEGKYGRNCDQACTCVHGKCSSGIEGDSSCECDIGWRGVTCKTIKDDACNASCHTSANCLLSNGTAYCKCAAGFEGNRMFCTAIDACKTSNSGCSAKAECRRTTPGNRVCVCNAGYTGDRIVCIEINPCLQNHGGCDRNAKCTQTGPNHVKDWVSKGAMAQVLQYHTEIPGVDEINIYDPEKWDASGAKLWNQATREEPIASSLLVPWRTVFEVIKKHVISKDQAKPSAPPLVTAEAADEPDKDNPLDPGPIDPDREPDLYPPYPHDTWKTIKKEAEKQGDVDLLKDLSAAYPVLYEANRGPRWEGLSFTVVKELRKGVFDFGLSSLYTTNLLGSIMKSYTLCPQDCKTLAQLILTSTQYMIWFGHWRQAAKQIALGYLKCPQGDPDSLDKQIENEEATDIILKKLAIENANEDCQKMLRPLNNPTLLQMTEAYNRLSHKLHNWYILMHARQEHSPQKEGLRVLGQQEPLKYYGLKKSLEKLQQLQRLVDEQLQAGHLVPTTSPWNSPVFVIQKKSGKWHLLHDLRKINDVIEDMGSMQPGLLSPTMIPKDWCLMVIDLRDCFFTIPLDPCDTPKFAFSVLTPERKELPNALVYHYMDDILVATKNDTEMQHAMTIVLKYVTQSKLEIAPEKQWGVRHTTGIPHSSTGQAIVERAHGSLKSMLLKQKGGVCTLSPHERLAKAIYVLNFLNQWSDQGGPPIARHFLSAYDNQQEIKGKGEVMIRVQDGYLRDGSSPHSHHLHYQRHENDHSILASTAAKDEYMSNFSKMGKFRKTREAVVFEKHYNSLVLNKAEIIFKDAAGTNGVIHIINQILVPSHLQDFPSKKESLKMVAAKHGYILFSSLLEKNNLLGLINDPIHKPVTLFWPTDTAISVLPQEQQDFLFKKSNTDKLVQYLKFHVVRDAPVLAYQIPGSTSLKTLQGSNLSISCGDNGEIGTLFLNDRQCKIVQRQLEFDGGITYSIDCLLTDPSLGGRCDSFFTMDFMGHCVSCFSNSKCPPGTKPKEGIHWCTYKSYGLRRDDCCRNCSMVIHTAKCYKGYFGPYCQACPGGPENPCNNHSSCDDGYTGTGECHCSSGFNGTSCELCLPGKYGSNCRHTFKFPFHIVAPSTVPTYPEPHFEEEKAVGLCKALGQGAVETGAPPKISGSQYGLREPFLGKASLNPKPGRIRDYGAQGTRSSGCNPNLLGQQKEVYMLAVVQPHILLKVSLNIHGSLAPSSRPAHANCPVPRFTDLPRPCLFARSGSLALPRGVYNPPTRLGATPLPPLIGCRGLPGAVGARAARGEVPGSGIPLHNRSVLTASALPLLPPHRLTDKEDKEDFIQQCNNNTPNNNSNRDDNVQNKSYKQDNSHGYYQQDVLARMLQQQGGLQEENKVGMEITPNDPRTTPGVICKAACGKNAHPLRRARLSQARNGRECAERKSWRAWWGGDAEGWQSGCGKRGSALGLVPSQPFSVQPNSRFAEGANQGRTGGSNEMSVFLLGLWRCRRAAGTRKWGVAAPEPRHRPLVSLCGGTCGGREAGGAERGGGGGGGGGLGRGVGGGDGRTVAPRPCPPRAGLWPPVREQAGRLAALTAR